MRTHLLAIASILIPAGVASAQKKVESDEKAKPVVIELRGTDLTMVTPKNWETKKPRFPDIINYEFAAPADAKEGEPTAKITISRAGGSVKANIARWEGQMEKINKDKSNTTEMKVAEQKVTLVDLHGSFKDTMGAPPMMRVKPKIRDNYRMLGAVIETKGGLQFVKAIGPAEVMDKLADPITKMIKEMKSSK